jgi:hypothetical protein
MNTLRILRNRFPLLGKQNRRTAKLLPSKPKKYSPLFKKHPQKRKPASSKPKISKKLKELPNKMFNLTDGLFNLVNSDPILLAHSLREQALMLTKTVFDIDMNVNVNENKNDKLSTIISSKTGHSKKLDTETMKETYQTYKTYVTSMVQIEYLLHYSYALEKYGNSMLSKSLNSANTSRKSRSSRRKTLRSRGGSRQDVNTSSNFFSYITGRFMTFRKGTLFTGETYSADPKSVAYYHSIKDLDQARNSFYKKYDEERSKQAPSGIIENIMRYMSTTYNKIFSPTPSDYEFDLIQFWINNREKYNTIAENENTIVEIHGNLDENNSQYIDINDLKHNIKKIKEELKEGLDKIEEEHHLVDLISQYYGRIISYKYNGKREVDLLITSIKKKITTSYEELIDLLLQYKVAQGVQLQVLEESIRTSQKLPDISTIQEDMVFKQGIDVDMFEREKEVATMKLKKLLRNILSSMDSKIERNLRQKIEKGESILDASTHTYRTLPQHAEIKQNLNIMASSGLFFYLNKFGTSPGNDMIGIGQSIQNSIPFIIEIVKSFVDTSSITADSIDALYIYIQIFLVAFATPVLLQKIFGSGGLTGSTAYNVVVAVIQFLLIVGTIVIQWNNLDVVNKEYAAYPNANIIPSCKYETSYSMYCSNSQEYYGALLKYYLDSMSIGLTNNTILFPTYYLHQILRGNLGRTIIGVELGWLLYSSCSGMIANYKDLGKKKEEIEIETFVKLNEITFNEEYMNQIIDEFKKSTLENENKELREGLINALGQLSREQYQNSDLMLKAASTMAQVTMANIQREQHESRSNEVVSSSKPLRSITRVNEEEPNLM